jgi:hypothetical protein
MKKICESCGKKLVGRQTRYCSVKCKQKYSSREGYLFDYRKHPKRKYSVYKNSAKSRSIDFLISYEEFYSMWHKPCSYCGSEIETIGIDRIDNNIGYIIGNIAPCCTTCNLMKRKMKTEEFLSHVAKIYENGV